MVSTRVCPHCQRFVTITNTICGESSTCYFKNAIGRVTLRTTFIVCPNPECQKFTLSNSFESEMAGPGRADKLGDEIQSWRLIPPSNAKVFPSFIPQSLISDYVEACQIVDLSPKASATLSRRCLQGIIRDFWQVKPGRLVDEIKGNRIKLILSHGRQLMPLGKSEILKVILKKISI